MRLASQYRFLHSIQEIFCRNFLISICPRWQFTGALFRSFSDIYGTCFFARADPAVFSIFTVDNLNFCNAVYFSQFVWLVNSMTVLCLCSHLYCFPGHETTGADRMEYKCECLVPVIGFPAALVKGGLGL